MNDEIMKTTLEWVEQGRIPDFLVRWGIRRLCQQRLDESHAGDCERVADDIARLRAECERSAVAIETDKANEQHYELPPEFFGRCLGRHRKYSSCYWDETTPDLDAAEARALELTCEHAELEDGQRVLELGCGWGSLTLFMAAQYPNSRITAVSNSAPQREHILNAANERGLTNLDVITADVNEFTPNGEFDRVVSVEMFEHVRNHRELMERIAGWLVPDGQLFVHIFCHRQVAYPFETTSESDWIGRYFFTGGIMPSADWLLHFQDHLALERRWDWSGTHYERTANAWLRNLDRERSAVMPILEAVYGPENAHRWFHRWRIFFMACAELWGFRGGQEWWVSHYRFRRRPTPIAANRSSEMVESVGH